MEMYTYTVSQTDLQDAENFLVAFLKERIPDGNFEKGSATRDIMVTGFAAIYAFLRGEIDRTTAKQSLMRIQEEFTDSDDIQQSVNELLSNWFVTRKGGTYATVFARFHFQSQQDARTIPATAQFWKTQSLMFVLDTPNTNYVISRDQQFPVFDSKQRLVEYVCDIPLRASKPGSAYKVTPGKFLKVVSSTGMSDLLYAETVDDVTGGDDVESTEDLVGRAETVISVRNLVNSRSCDVVLQNEFPTISETMTLGMGEPEMIRDVPKELGAHLQMHLGGSYDTYVTMPRTIIQESGIVGGYYPRADGMINVFRDPDLTHITGRTFSAIGVKPGHILHIYAGVRGAPQVYLISSVSDHEILVSENNPFQEVTPVELDAGVFLTYSIGYYSPDYQDFNLADDPLSEDLRVRAAGNVTEPSIRFGTSDTIQQPGKFALTRGPVLDVRSVEITKANYEGSSMIDPTSANRIVFGLRVNGEPINVEGTTQPEDTQYQIQVLNPEKAQSMSAVNLVNLGGVSGGASIFDNAPVTVTYESFQGFSSVHDYVVDRSRRVVAANQLIRARNPVWITFTVSYKLYFGTTFSESEASAGLAEFINAFKDINMLDSSDITTFLRGTYATLATVYPVVLQYTLDAPDGQQAILETTDEVSIYPSEANGVTLQNGADIRTPAELKNSGKIVGDTIGTTTDLLAWYNWMGVSDRTTSYRTRADLITFSLRQG